jgi:hypothetical protein
MDSVLPFLPPATAPTCGQARRLWQQDSPEGAGQRIASVDLTQSHYRATTTIEALLNTPRVCWVKDSMRKEHDASGQDPDRLCDHCSRRVIRLWWPYADASIIRVRFATENGGQFGVSPLYKTEGAWAFSICRECAKRTMTALAVFLMLLGVP